MNHCHMGGGGEEGGGGEKAEILIVRYGERESERGARGHEGNCKCC